MSASITTYQDLITSEHANKPKFFALVGAVSQTFVDLQNFLASLPTAFDIDDAVNEELDSVGVWVGLNRDLKATVPGIFTPAPQDGIVPLGNTDYRTLMYGKVGSNHWDGTLTGAFDGLTDIFGTGFKMFMIDHQDMSMDIAIAGNVPSEAFQVALSGGYMQVRPCGVLANYYFPTAPGGPLFGFGVDNEFIGGFGHGVWASKVEA